MRATWADFQDGGVRSRQPASFATIREKFRTPKTRPFVPAFGQGGALIQMLPSGGSWPADDRINWLKMLVMGFQVAYGADDEIEIKKKEAAN